MAMAMAIIQFGTLLSVTVNFPIPKSEPEPEPEPEPVQENTVETPLLLEFEADKLILLRALKALAEPEFNPTGLGSIEISKETVDISVRSGKIMGCFSFTPLEFENSDGLHIKKTVDVGRILHKLYYFPSDVKTVTVYLWSTHLLFKHGDSEFQIKLVEPETEDDIFPGFKRVSSTEGLVPRRKWKRFVIDLYEADCPLVSAMVQSGQASITAGPGIEEDEYAMTVTCANLPSHAKFLWLYAFSLELASVEEGQFYVRLIGPPLHWVMMKISYKGVGDGDIMYLTGVDSVHIEEAASDGAATFADASAFHPLFSQTVADSLREWADQMRREQQ